MGFGMFVPPASAYIVEGIKAYQADQAKRKKEAREKTLQDRQDALWEWRQQDRERQQKQLQEIDKKKKINDYLHNSGLIQDFVTPDLNSTIDPNAKYARAQKLAKYYALKTGEEWEPVASKFGEYKLKNKKTGDVISLHRGQIIGDMTRWLDSSSPYLKQISYFYTPRKFKVRKKGEKKFREIEVAPITLFGMSDIEFERPQKERKVKALKDIDPSKDAYLVYEDGTVKLVRHGTPKKNNLNIGTYVKEAQAINKAISEDLKMNGIYWNQYTEEWEKNGEPVSIEEVQKLKNQTLIKLAKLGNKRALRLLEGKTFGDKQGNKYVVRNGEIKKILPDNSPVTPTPGQVRIPVRRKQVQANPTPRGIVRITPPSVRSDGFWGRK
jgi:hypothetical protein